MRLIFRTATRPLWRSFTINVRRRCPSCGDKLVRAVRRDDVYLAMTGMAVKGRACRRGCTFIANRRFNDRRMIEVVDLGAEDPQMAGVRRKMRLRDWRAHVWLARNPQARTKR